MRPAAFIHSELGTHQTQDSAGFSLVISSILRNARLRGGVTVTEWSGRIWKRADHDVLELHIARMTLQADVAFCSVGPLKARRGKF
jgi:hypothetical protein